MKRFHVHLRVKDLAESIDFYNTLFAATPTVTKTDYAKWQLEDPRVNFAISTTAGVAAGVEHLGIQVEQAEELSDVYGRMVDAKGKMREEGHTTCCYAQSEKAWIADPQGVEWEAFHTYGDSTVYGDGEKGKPMSRSTPAENSCC